ncbi:hypothetical protein [Azospirillum sp. TSO22-1]|uniref:hypothetical protein n=1 Tax=Azospirillum sp. TSO22-1 TaxID=716789 RepID=UPI001304B19A|nr:hypothetical protein [Azospirillum sp. TSO22-1]
MTMQDRSLYDAVACTAETEGAAGAIDATPARRRDTDLVSVCMARWPGGIGEEPLFTDA